MNTTTTIADDNTKINVKTYLLDPLSVIVKLAILSNKPVGTKLLIQNNVIYFQEPGPFQSLCRIFYNTNKTDLQFIYNPLHLACLHFLSESFVEKTPRIKQLFECAQRGVKKLIETYKNCSILTITLNYYYALITNHLHQSYNEHMFMKDSFTCYYTEPICNALNAQWTETKIKIVLDIIVFLNTESDATNNVKSLETIMTGIDDTTRIIVSEI